MAEGGNRRRRTTRPPGACRYWKDSGTSDACTSRRTLRWTGEWPQTIDNLARQLRAREVTSAQLVDACLHAIDTCAIHSSTPSFWCARMRHGDRLREADREPNAGVDRGPLHGIPVSLKDIFDLQGIGHHCRLCVRDGIVASQDAPVVERLRAPER